MSTGLADWFWLSQAACDDQHLIERAAGLVIDGNVGRWGIESFEYRGDE